jgi:predicted nucleic acid-binding protein
VIFVDSNVPMYLVGNDHPHKMDARRLLERMTTERQRLVTDVEVFQELLHRYREINRPDAIVPAFDVLQAIVDEVFVIDIGHVRAARDILLGRWALSAREALHVAMMQAHGVTRILSFDRDFDQVPDVERIG